MRITIVLPFVTFEPIGGVKMAYEFANHLQRRGHRVTILHAAPYWQKHSKALGRFIRSSLNYWALRTPISWFPVHRDVQLLAVPSLDQKYVPSGDVVIATAWDSTGPVANYGPEKGRKFYLIQHYEIWAGSKDEVDATWRLPLHKIVIARWLWDIGEQFGETARMTYVPLGLDHTAFRLTRPIEGRDFRRVAMLYHTSDWKGAMDGIAALHLVRQHIPDVHPIFFGTPERPTDLPDWIDYKQQPRSDQHLDLYNTCAIFLHTSWTEGFGLTSIEAMACGCALIATANDGVRDYAFEGKTALLSPIKNPEAMAQAILRLMGNESLRYRLAMTGNRYIEHYQWEYSAERMERALLGQAAGWGPTGLIDEWVHAAEGMQ